MDSNTKSKLHKWTVFVFTIIANIMFIGGLCIVLFSGDYDLFSKIFWSVPVIILLGLWDFLVLGTFCFPKWIDKVNNLLKKQQ